MAPILLFIGAIALLVVAVGALIYYWDDLKKRLVDSGPFQWIKRQIGTLIEFLNKIPGIDIETEKMDLSDTEAGKLNIDSQSASDGNAGESIKQSVSSGVNNNSDKAGDRNLTVITNQEVNTRKIKEMFDVQAMM